MVGVVDEEAWLAGAHAGRTRGEEVAPVNAGQAAIDSAATGLTILRASLTSPRPHHPNIPRRTRTYTAGPIQKLAWNAAAAIRNRAATHAGRHTGRALEVGAIGVGGGRAVLLALAVEEVELGSERVQAGVAVGLVDRAGRAGR